MPLSNAQVTHVMLALLGATMSTFGRICRAVLTHTFAKNANVWGTRRLRTPRLVRSTFGDNPALCSERLKWPAHIGSEFRYGSNCEPLISLELDTQIANARR